MASISGSLSATGSVTLNKAFNDSLCNFSITGTQTGLSFVFEGSVDQVNFFPLAAQLMSDGSLATSTISPADLGTFSWIVPSEGCFVVRLRVTAISGGTVTVTANSASYVGTRPITTTTNSATSASTTNITSTSANAFTVGASGTTNPVFQINANTASVATGIKITGAAAGGGVAMAVISSGANEGGTLDTKGTGTFGINTVNNSAGLVTVGNSTNVCGMTVVGPFTVNNNINQNASINAGTSTGTVTIGNTAAGAVSIQSSAASIFKVTGNSLTIGTLTSGTTAIVSAGLLTLTGVGASVWTPGAGATIVSDGVTGIKIATATTQLLGFYNATPVAQPAASTNSTTGTAGTATGVSLDTTFKGNGGTAAFTIGGVVTALKSLGLLAA